MLNDTKGIQTVQVTLLDGECAELPRHQEYGFTSRPPEGSEAVAAFIGGNRDNGIVISCEHRKYRLKLPDQADVALYDINGNKVHLSPSNDKITVEAKSGVEILAVKTTGGNIIINATGIAGKVEVNAEGPGGEVVVNAANIYFGEKLLATAGGGVVTTMCACITGGVHPMGSQNVKSKIV
jgi:phage baseplate assembly protein V